jgi:S-adenosylhomocysteine hydrolase
VATQSQTHSLAGDVKDIGLAESGKRKIEWANQQMPVLQLIRKRFTSEQPLKGIRVSACLHVTSATAARRFFFARPIPFRRRMKWPPAW